MTLDVTLGAMAAFLVLGVFCGWRGARAPDFRKGPRMIPWRFLMLLCGAAELLLLVHLFALLQGQ